MLLPAERALAALELSQVDRPFDARDGKPQAASGRCTADHTLVANANKRLQTEMDENARLRKELDAARAKLDAIANIEKSLNERKPGTTPLTVRTRNHTLEPDRQTQGPHPGRRR